MKVSVLQDKLDAALKQVKNVVDKKAKLPVLSCVWLHPYDATLLIDATNLDQSLSVRVGARVDMEGKGIVLQYEVLAKLVSKFTPERVDIRVDYSTLTATFTCGNKQFDLKGIDPDEFPQLPEIEPDFELSAEDMITAINQIRYATHKGGRKDVKRPVLETISVRFNGDKTLDLCAVDGTRMATTTVKIPTLLTPTQPFQALIHNSNIPGLLDFLKSANQGKYFGDITMQYNEQRKTLGFATRRATYWTTLYEGTFPAYEAIVPGHFDLEICAHREEMIDIAQSCEMFADGIYFQWDQEKLTLHMSAGSAERGEFRGQTNATGTWKGNFGIEAKLFIEALQHLESEIVTLWVSLAGPIIKIEGKDESGGASALVFGLDLRNSNGKEWWV